MRPPGCPRQRNGSVSWPAAHSLKHQPAHCRGAGPPKVCASARVAAAGTRRGVAVSIVVAVAALGCAPQAKAVAPEARSLITAGMRKFAGGDVQGSVAAFDRCGAAYQSICEVTRRAFDGCSAPLCGASNQSICQVTRTDFDR